MAPPRVRRSHRRRWRRGECCEPEALRRARGGSRPGRQHRRPGPGPGRGPRGPVGQGPVPEGQGLRRLHRAPGPPGPGRPRRARAPRSRRGRHGGGRPDGAAGASCPASTATTYPGRARAVPRSILDDALRTAALDAGADTGGGPGRPSRPDPARQLDGFAVDGGPPVRADFVIGADGATSHVARVGRPGGRGRGCCGASPCAATSTRPCRSRPSPCGSRPRGGPSPATAGSSRGPTGWPTSAWGWAPWPTARPARRRCGSCPPTCGTWPTSASSTGCRTGAVPAGWEAGSRWAWSGRCPPPAGCCWWATRPDWSTRSRARASPRP